MDKQFDYICEAKKVFDNQFNIKGCCDKIISYGIIIVLMTEVKIS